MLVETALRLVCFAVFAGAFVFALIVGSQAIEVGVTLCLERLSVGEATLEGCIVGKKVSIVCTKLSLLLLCSLIVRSVKVFDLMVVKSFTSVVRVGETVIVNFLVVPLLVEVIEVGRVLVLVRGCVGFGECFRLLNLLFSTRRRRKRKTVHLDKSKLTM